MSCLQQNLNYIVIKNCLGIKNVKAIKRYEKINFHRFREVTELLNEIRDGFSIEKTVKRMSDNIEFLENFIGSSEEILKKAELN